MVTLPQCCAADLDAQYNTGSDELKVPNLMPDIVTRVVFNPIKAVHVDVGGVFACFATPSRYEDDFTEVGGGVNINARFNVTASTKLLLQSAFGSGLGRYVGGLVPDVAFQRRLNQHDWHDVVGRRRGAKGHQQGVAGWLL